MINFEIIHKIVWVAMLHKAILMGGLKKNKHFTFNESEVQLSFFGSKNLYDSNEANL